MGTDPAVPATFGKVTSVVITNPGVIAGTATVSLVGGGGTGAAVSVSSTGPNTSGGFTKTGTGKLTLTGSSTYTGRTTVNEGTLSVSGAGNLAASSGLSVGSGATFAYFPTVPAPLTFGPGSTLNLADNSTIATSFDSTIVVSGAASTSGTVNLALSGTFNSGSTYNVLSAGSGLGAVNYRILNPSNFTYTATSTATGVTITPTAASALASAYWIGGFAGNPGLWSVSDGSSASNWTADGTGTLSPLVPGAATNVIFSDATASPGNQTGMKLGADMAIGSLTFNSTNPVSLLNSDASVLSIGNGITLTPTAGPVTLSANIAATSAQTWTNNSLNPFSVSAINTAGFALTLGGSGSSSLAGVVSGTGTLTKTGTGTATLTAANTYSGATTIAEGTLTLSGARTGTSGAITLGTAAGLNSTLNISAGTYNLGGNRFNVGNSSTTAATSTVNQTGGAVSFTSSDELLIGQNTVGNQGVYNLSGGSITTYTSTTRGIMLGVNSNPAPGLNSGGGTFNLSGTGAINMTAASGAPGDGILQIGRSDAVANNTTNAFNQTGGTANVGILALGGGATSGSAGVNATLNLTGGTFTANQFTLLSAGATNTSTINIGGSAVVTLPAFPTARGSGATATVNFDGGTLRPTAAVTNYMGGLTNAFIKAGGAKFETTFGITIAQNLLADPGSPGGGLTKTGPANSTLTLSGSNTYTGGTTITSGRIAISTAAPLSSGTVTIPGDSTVGGQLFVTGTPTITNNFVISGVGYPDTITTANTGRGGAIRASTGQTFSGSITLADDSRIGFIAGTSSATLSGQITGSKAIDFYGGLSGNSALHTFILANTGTANDHAGNTSITSVDFGAARTGGQAILQLGAGNQIPNGTGKGNLIFNGADANHLAILELNGFNETINGVSNVAAAGAIIRNTSTGASVLTIGDADTTSTFSGVISDGGTGKTLDLAKTGTGTLTLTGANSYIGNTAVNAGTLVLADDAQLKFVLGASTGVNNSLTGAGTAVLDGDFVIDTTAADALDSGTWTLENVSSLAGAYGATFTVAGFTDAGSNNWEKSISPTKKYVFNETTGTLTLTPVVGGYAPWINGFFPGVTNQLITGPTADPDFDGIANGIEMVIGGNPATGMDTALLPTLELVTDPVASPAIPAGNYLLFTYRRSDLSVAGGVTATCETGLDLLATWTTAVGGVSGVVIQVDDNFAFTPPAGADTDRVRVYVPRGATPSIFGRLKALVP